MAEVRPFRGLRYSPEAAKDLGAQLAPPFDVISPAQQRELHERSPHNIVRLELGAISPEDTEENNRYTRSRAYLQEWLQQQVLVREDSPTFYLCRHQFELDGKEHVRWELLGQVRLANWEQRVVLPHERTLPEPKADRMQLLRATKTNISPVFSLYRDPDGLLAAVLERESHKSPMAHVVHWGLASFTLWAITDPAVLAQISAFFTSAHLYIADGHHRYETALAYRQERLNGAAATGQEGFNYVFMSLTRLEDPGLLILPIHRMVKGVASKITLGGLRIALDIRWHVTAQPFQDWEQALPGCLETLRSLGEEGPAFAVYGLELDTMLFLQPRDRNALLNRLPLDFPQELRDLDLTLLHQTILHGYLGIGQEAYEIEAALGFTQEAPEAIAAVQRDACQLAFLVNSTKVEQIVAVAEAGEKMPQKSTFFYPKLPTGLLLCPLEDTTEQ